MIYSEYYRSEKTLEKVEHYIAALCSQKEDQSYYNTHIVVGSPGTSVFRAYTFLLRKLADTVRAIFDAEIKNAKPPTKYGKKPRGITVEVE